MPVVRPGTEAAAILELAAASAEEDGHIACLPVGDDDVDDFVAVDIAGGNLVGAAARPHLHVGLEGTVAVADDDRHLVRLGAAGDVQETIARQVGDEQLIRVGAHLQVPAGMTSPVPSPPRLPAISFALGEGCDRV